MRIAIVSTWGSHCGIATYSEQLAGALVEQGHTVVVYAPHEEGSAFGAPPGIPFHMLWDRRGGGVEELLAAVERDQIDVLHVQHEFGLHRNTLAFHGMLAALKRRLPVVVTLHTVFTPLRYDSRGPFFDVLASLCDAVIVHTVESEIAVSVAGVKRSKLWLVPHGTPSVRAGDPERGRELLHLPSKLSRDLPVGLVNGFISRGKNLVGTIRAFAQAIQRWGTKIGVLVVKGSDEYSGPFASGLLPAVITECGVEETRVFLRTGYSQDADVPHIMAAAQYGILNTVSNTLSASGQVHLHAACGLPIAVANRPIYSDAIRAGLPCFEVDQRDPEWPHESLVSVIGCLAGSADFRAFCQERALALAADTAWSKIAEMTVTIYQKLVQHRKEQG